LKNFSSEQSVENPLEPVKIHQNRISDERFPGEKNQSEILLVLSNIFVEMESKWSKGKDTN